MLPLKLHVEKYYETVFALIPTPCNHVAEIFLTEVLSCDGRLATGRYPNVVYLFQLAIVRPPSGNELSFIRRLTVIGLVHETNDSDGR